MALRAGVLLLVAAAGGGASARAVVCPTAAVSNTTCYCTSGCSINTEFAFAWSPPVYPPAATELLGDTICGALTLPCSVAASDLVSFLGISGYVRGGADSGYHLFTGCAPNMTVTFWTGFTTAECQLLTVRYAALYETDPTTAYVPPLLCNTDNCNAVVGPGVGIAPGCAASAGLRPAALLPLWSLLLTFGLAVALSEAGR